MARITSLGTSREIYAIFRKNCQFRDKHYSPCVLSWNPASLKKKENIIKPDTTRLSETLAIFKHDIGYFISCIQFPFLYFSLKILLSSICLGTAVKFELEQS